MTTNFKKTLLATASAAAIALTGANAFAAAQNVGDSSTVVITTGNNPNFNGTAGNVTGVGTIADGITMNGATATGAGTGTVRFLGGATVDAAIGTTGNFEIGAIELNGADGKNVAFQEHAVFNSLVFANDSTLTITDAKNIGNSDATATNTITTATDGKGSIVVSGTTTFDGAIGTSSAALKAITLNGAGGKTATFKGAVYSKTLVVAGAGTGTFSSTLNADDINFSAAGTLNLDGHVSLTNDIDFANNAGTISLGDGANLTSTGTGGVAVRSTGGANGTFTVDGTSTITGAIGTEAATGVATLNAGAAGKVATFAGKVFATDIKVTGTGKVVFNEDVAVASANGIDFDAAGTVELADGKTITGIITSGAAGQGTLDLLGDATITGTVGSVGSNELASIEISGADGKTVTFNSAVLTRDVNLDNDSTVVFAGGIDSTGGTDKFTTATDGEGSISIGAASTLIQDVGASALKFKKITFTGSADNTIDVQKGLYANAIELNDSDSNNTTHTTLSFSTNDGSVVSGPITTTTTNTGKITLSTDTTFESTVGASAAVLNSFAVTAAKTATLKGDAYATQFLLSNANAALSLAAGADINGNVVANADGDGDLTVAATGTVINGTVGSAAKEIDTINITALTNTTDTLTFKDNVYAKTFTATGAKAKVNISSGKVLSADTFTASSENYVLNIDGSKLTDGARLVSSGPIDLTNSTVTLSVASNTTFIKTGDTFTIADGGAAGTKVAGTLNTDSYVLTFEQTDTGEDITAKATRTNSYTTSSTVSHIGSTGTALEAIGNAGTGTTAFKSLLGSLDSKSKTDLAAALDTLTPEVNGAAEAASFEASNQALGTVETRLASLRDGSTGIPTGSGIQDGAFWAQGFGKTATQDTRDGVTGYDADTWGATVGIDGQISSTDRVGVSFAYANTEVDAAVTGNDTDIDSYQLNVYASRDNGKWYVDGLLGFGWNDYDQSRTLFDNTVAKGDWDGQQYTGKVSGGYKLTYGNGLELTPKGSLQYSFLTQDSYTEVGSSAPLTVDADDSHRLEAGLGVDLAMPFVEGGNTFVPRVSAEYLYDFIGDETESTGKFATGNSFTVKGADVAQGTLRLGAGLTLLTQDNIELSVDYSGDIKEDYDSHAGAVKVRVNF